MVNGLVRRSEMTMTDAQHEADVECIYCYSLTTPVDVPTVGDDAMWDAIAGEHDTECEWVQTRAHRMGE
jgi:hypothetical protein